MTAVQHELGVRAAQGQERPVELGEVSGSAASGRGTGRHRRRHGRRGRGSRPTSARRSSRRRPGSRGSAWPASARSAARSGMPCADDTAAGRDDPILPPPVGQGPCRGNRLVSISIQFLGAAGCVTGSQFLVSVGDRRVLVDCGMFQGSPQEVERNFILFAFEPGTLDALLLTHAHLDHCGRIPALTRAGYRPGRSTRHPGHRRPRRGRPARFGEAPGRVHEPMEPAPGQACRARSRPTRRRSRGRGPETDDPSFPERPSRTARGQDRDPPASLRRARRGAGNGAHARVRLRRRGPHHGRRHGRLPRRRLHPRVGDHRDAPHRWRGFPQHRLLGDLGRVARRSCATRRR